MTCFAKFRAATKWNAFIIRSSCVFMNIICSEITCIPKRRCITCLGALPVLMHDGHARSRNQACRWYYLCTWASRLWVKCVYKDELISIHRWSRSAHLIICIYYTSVYLCLYIRTFACMHAYIWTNVCMYRHMCVSQNRVGIKVFTRKALIPGQKLR